MSKVAVVDSYSTAIDGSVGRQQLLVIDELDLVVVGTSDSNNESLWVRIEAALRGWRNERAHKRGRPWRGYGSGTLGDDPLGAVRDMYRALCLAHARGDEAHANHSRRPSQRETAAAFPISRSTLRRICPTWPPL